MPVPHAMRNVKSRSCAEIRVSGIFGAGLAAVGFRHVNDDLLGVAINLLLDGGKGAEEQVTGVSHDGSASRRDPVVGLELVEFTEGMVDVGGGTKFLDVADEGGSEVGLVELFLAFGSVLEAEAGVRVGDGETAEAAAGDRAMLTMERFGINVGTDG
jgi:hypothetical protein